MIKAEDTVLILLAAGKSARFGGKDKLAETYLGQPLAFHVVTALEAVPFAERVAVVRDTDLDFGARAYEVIRDDGDNGLASSLRLGVEAARKDDPQAVLIAFADMPRVTGSHIHRMLDYGEGEAAILASSDGCQPRPPALFGRAHFDTLVGLDGDNDVREMIRRAHHVIAVTNELIDIDTPEDLERLRAGVGINRPA